jgi:predicted DNA-binding transcriptional regulator AlpA
MRLIRYPDLVEKGVVNSRMTLKRLIDLHEFPPGRLVTPNSRAWTEEEVDEWVEGRPVARKSAAPRVEVAA